MLLLPYFIPTKTQIKSSTTAKNVLLKSLVEPAAGFECHVTVNINIVLYTFLSEKLGKWYFKVNSISYLWLSIIIVLAFGTLKKIVFRLPYNFMVLFFTLF